MFDVKSRLLVLGMIRCSQKQFTSWQILRKRVDFDRWTRLIIRLKVLVRRIQSYDFHDAPSKPFRFTNITAK